ncbi:MAG: peptidoglycan DD-metalloendopeptidase family protein [Zoogloeaceae bacterium]|jgi:lipoprotein NlpD|nr:peptidoglycan DD-metalloendopeptidase family protein [Zoogloeaceae bacterium]
MLKKFPSQFAVAACALAFLGGCASNSPAPVENRSQSLPGLSARTPVGPGDYTVQKGDTLYSIALEKGQDYRDIAAWNNIADPSILSIGQVLRVTPPEGGAATQAVTTMPVATGTAVEQRSLDAPSSVSANTATLKREPRVNKEPYSDAAYARAQTPAAAPAPAATSTPAKTAETASAAPPPATATPTPAAAGAATASASGLTWSWPASGKTLTAFSAQSKGIDIAGKAGDPILAASDGKVVYAGSGLRGYGQLVIIKHNATFLSAYAHNRKILVQEGQNVKRGAKIAEMGNTDSEVVKLHFEVRQQGNPVEPLNFLPK